MHASSEMKSAWTQYWKSGQSGSLPEDRAAGRLGALDAAWKVFFESLPQQSTIVDLATGGGDVIRAARAAARDFEITGVDIADLPSVNAQLPGVRLVGNTDLSSLPFGDAAFDGVMSQFGIEYADVAASTREAMRVLKPDGRGLFVLHHTDSVVTRWAVNSLAAYRTVFPDDSAIRMATAVLETRKRTAPPAVIMEADAELRREVSILQSRLRNEHAFGLARNVVTFLAALAKAPGLHPPAQGLRMLDSAKEQIQTNTLRQQAQVDAAMDGEKMENFVALLRAAGAAVGPPDELKYPNGMNLAWKCSFHKPTG
jgi:SAM-dependent methyltransferase